MTSSGQPVPHANSTQQGHRAGEAYVRPTPIKVHGSIKSYTFDLRTATFSMVIDAASSTPEDVPTEIFLPAWHCPEGVTDVEVTGGKFEVKVEQGLRSLRWWHAEGEQRIRIKGLARKNNGVGLEEDDENAGLEDEGYLKEYSKMCAVM